jgi:hypothetical protein
MSRESRPARASLLLNPFDRFGGGVAALVGAVVSALSLVVTRAGVRFDGFLDLHFARTRVAPLHVSLLEQACAWILPSVCFFAYARMRSKNVRAIDFLGMVGLARLPLFLAAIPAVMLAPELPTPIKMTPALLATTIVCLAGVAGMITWLYQGFKNAAGLAGPKVIGAFIAVTVVVEVLSKFALALLA